MKNADLKKLILEISYKHQSSHLGSCITAVDIIDEIYQIKKPDEKFVLSCGHAHLAHLVVMEKYKQIDLDAELLFARYGVHCDRDTGCDVSTGSLGQGLPIALGMALADRSKNVYCLISDGECAEGSIWEALHIIEDTLFPFTNLHIYLNLNLYGAYRIIEGASLIRRIEEVGLKVKNRVKIVYTNFDDFPFLNGIDAHYKVMTEEDYRQAMEVLNA